MASNYFTHLITWPAHANQGFIWGGGGVERGHLKYGNFKQVSLSPLFESCDPYHHVFSHVTSITASYYAGKYESDI